MTEQQAQADSGTRAYRPAKRGGGDARLIGGVCAGLGRATGVDPLVYRVAVVALTVAGGIGALAYAAGWLLLPAEDQEISLIEGWAKRRYDTTDVLAILGAMLAAGFVLSLLGGPGGSTLVSLVVLALSLLTAQRRGVDLGRLARTLPDHFRGRPAPAAGAPDAGTDPPSPGPVTTPAGAPSGGGAPDGAFPGPAEPDPGGAGTRPDGLIDLGAYGRGRPRDGQPAGGPGDGPYGPGTTPGPGARCPAAGVWLGTLFSFGACGAGLWAMALNAPVYGWDGVTTIGYGAATALVVLGVGLIAGAWFGRTRSLVGWGVILAVALVALPMIGTGSARTSVKEFVMRWHPTTVAQASQPARMGVGGGRMDLTDVPFTPGEPVTVSAEMRAGFLQVTVPRDAEVRIDGSVRFGDIRGGDRVYPSHRGRVRTTLAPLDTAAKRTPEIDLRLRGTIGDVEVRRAA